MSSCLKHLLRWVDPCLPPGANPTQGPGRRQQEHHASAQELRSDPALWAALPGASRLHSAPPPARAHPRTAVLGWHWADES